MSNLSTQQLLEIKEIREGTLLLKNKSIRGVLMVSSLNFALKSNDEQEAIIFQFQNFLNSLDFSIEIVIQSRILNITGYLEKLKEIELSQKNDLMRIQAADYHKFVNELVLSRQVLNKSFFVVIPFSLIDSPQTEVKKIKLSLLKKEEKTLNEEEEEFFRRAKSQLWQRMEFIASGLRRCGLQCTFLDSLELIELFWSLYHPEESEIGYYPEVPAEIIK